MACCGSPEPLSQLQADDLWRHTCFEAFVAAPGAAAYCEFNFSPSGAWAAYGFTGYRTGMTPLRLLAAPGRTGDGTLVAWRWRSIVQPGLPLIPPGNGPLHLALAAVIEEQSGALSYWALRHAPGQPDFHHRDGFALDLPGAAAEGTPGP